MNLEQVKKLESKLLLATYDRYPVLLHKGNGVYVYDHKGRRYLDFLSGIGVNALGYAHPAITKTIARQAKAADPYVEPFLQRVSGQAGRCTDEDFRTRARVLYQQRHGSLGSSHESGARLCQSQRC